MYTYGLDGGGVRRLQRASVVFPVPDPMPYQPDPSAAPAGCVAGSQPSGMRALQRSREAPEPGRARAAAACPVRPGQERTSRPEPAPRRRRHWGLAAHLLAFGLALLLPALGVGAASAWQAVHAYRTAFEARLRDTAAALALALDSEFETLEAAAVALASSPALRHAPDHEVPALRAWAAEIGQALGGARVVVNDAARGHRQLLNTGLPEGAPMPPPSRPGEGAWDVIRRAAESGRPAVSDLYAGRSTGAARVAVAAPVAAAPGGPVRRVVVVAIDPARLSRLLAAQDLAGGAVAGLADGKGRVVARSRGHAPFVGAPVPGWYAATAGRAEGVFRGANAEGVPAVFGFRRLRTAPGWGVVVGEPLSAYDANWRWPLLNLACGTALVLAFAAAAAAGLARRVLAPVHALRRQADRAVAGRGGGPAGAAPDAPAPVAEFEALRLAIVRADAALRASEAEFRAAFEQAPVAMSQSDPATGLLLRVNDAYCELVGRSAAWLAGRSFTEITHPDDRDRERGTWGRMVRGEVPGYESEKRFVRPDGSIRWARVTATVVRGPDGRALRTMVAARDVTDRKAAEEALRESEERLRAVVDATPECVKVVGPDGALLQMNPAGLRVLGAAPERVLGRPVLELVAPEFREEWAANHARVCRGEALVWEFDVVTLDGRRRRMETHAVPLRLPGGGPLAHLGVTRDVTDRTAAAERQELLMRELDHRAKNALAVVQAALRLTPKDDPSAYARAVEGRVAALARAHTLLARAQWTGADLRAMAEGELAPFLDTGASAPGAGPRAELDGPPLALKPGAAQALSMALHELATNATKHGALSASGGRVSLSWRVDRASGELRLRWVERGGPRVSAPPARRGFGSRVLDGTVRGQLGGAVSRAWEPAGLVCEVGVPLAQVAPSAA